MKGKKITADITLGDLLGGFATGFGGMLYESKEDRDSRKSGNSKGKDWIVDTCYTPDTGLYETGISCKWISDSNWVIVEEYETEEESVRGHEKWVKHIKTKPKKLFSIQTSEWETT